MFNDEETDSSVVEGSTAKIKVIGVGGGGCNVRIKFMGRRIFKRNLRKRS